MKARSIPINRLFPFLLLLLMTGSPLLLPAQTDSAAPTEAAAPEGPELISPSIEFTAVQKADNSIDLKALMKAKVNSQFIRLYKLKLTFFRVTEAGDQELGFVITDGTGKALLNVKADTLQPDAEGKLQFKVVYAGNKSIEAAEELVSFKRAKLSITPVKEDSLLQIQVRLVDLGTGEEVPVKETAVGIYVKRSFLPLKVGEGTTDEAGEAVIEFPANLPGDAKGNLTLLGRVDENELYGNLEAVAVQPWGKPVSDEIKEQPRALWSTHPPIWMLVTFIILMATVWGHYFVIIYELFRLRKEKV